MEKLRSEVLSLRSRVGSLEDNINNLHISSGLSETEVRDIAEEYYDKLDSKIEAIQEYYKNEVEDLNEKISIIESGLNERINHLKWENSVIERYNIVKHYVPELRYEEFYRILYREEVIMECFNPLKIDFLIEYFSRRLAI